MKLITIAAFLFAVLCGRAQTKLIPGKNAVEKKWLKNQDYQMGWYAMKDTARFEIGKTITHISSDNDKIIVVTQVIMKQSKSPWVDTTIAIVTDLSPVYHSSHNAQRDMILNFGRVVTGFYNDKIKNERIIIYDTTKVGYFDSNLYPNLIGWLPLKEGYKQDISIYDYTAQRKSGVIKATVHNVKKGIYKSKKSGDRNVWIVSVSDEIGGGENESGVYYIDIADRRLWKQQIDAGGQKMEMELIEE